MSKLRVVLDTNAFLVSISRKSKFRTIFDSLLSSKIQLVISNEILMEYVEIIEQKANATVANNIAELLINRKNVEKIEISYKWNLIEEDFDDNKFVDCNCQESEGTLFKAHLSIVQQGDLITGDRNYPSFNSAYQISVRQCEFLFRCKINFNKLVCTFVESNKKEWATELAPQQGISFKNLPYDKNERIKVRLIKVELESGETEILMTSLLDKKKYPIQDFKDLYFQRWGVETFYDRFKHIIEVERFSGKSHQFIQQEFNCALYISNMQSILTLDIEVEKQIKAKTKNRKLEYKVNQSVSLGFIREKLISLFILDKKGSKEVMNELKKLFVLHLIPIRPDRKYERNTSKYRHRVKPKQFSNRRLLL